jgi:hypothetical protein
VRNLGQQVGSHQHLAPHSFTSPGLKKEGDAGGTELAVGGRGQV